MKKKNDYNAYLLCDLVIMILKGLIGIVGGSLTLVSTIIYDILYMNKGGMDDEESNRKTPYLS